MDREPLRLPDRPRRRRRAERLRRPGGSLSVGGGDAIVPIVNGEIATSRASGAFVVYTQDWHPERTPHFARTAASGRSTASGTPGAPSSTRGSSSTAPVVRKGTNGEDGYSGFTMRDPTTGETRPTELEALLRARGSSASSSAGLATDYCVKATALDAARLGFQHDGPRRCSRRGRPGSRVTGSARSRRCAAAGVQSAVTVDA